MFYSRLLRHPYSFAVGDLDSVDGVRHTPSNDGSVLSTQTGAGFCPSSVGRCSLWARGPRFFPLWVAEHVRTAQREVPWIMSCFMVPGKNVKDPSKRKRSSPRAKAATKSKAVWMMMGWSDLQRKLRMVIAWPTRSLVSIWCYACQHNEPLPWMLPFHVRTLSET